MQQRIAQRAASVGEGARLGFSVLALDPPPQRGLRCSLGIAVEKEDQVLKGEIGHILVDFAANSRHGNVATGRGAGDDDHAALLGNGRESIGNIVNFGRRNPGRVVVPAEFLDEQSFEVKGLQASPHSGS